jgi:uncharacterized secreted protein with C-terminal beta-propeller domain
MKKYLSLIVMAVAAVIFLSSCGASQYLTNNTNLQQTNVVLSQKNFHVVKNVESEVSSTYVFGIGGCSKEALKSNAVANLTKKANLTGSQALINVTVKSSGKFILFWNKLTFHASGTVIEFDE